MVRVKSGGEVRTTALPSERRPSRVDGRQAVVVGSGTGRGGAKKPTFEPTNPSQSVARSCTLLRKNRGTTIWTRRNATARDNLTRAATTDQKVGDSSSSERASKSPGSGLPEPQGAGGRFARPYKNPYSCRDELDL